MKSAAATFALEGIAPAAEQKRCAWASIERFAVRAWRRPLDAEERERIETFWRTNLAAGPANEAVALTVAGILQAPAFHFRLERGDAPGGRPTPWELATRLSYFLWDSMPDAELFAAAVAGELATRAGVERQVRRMLDDPKANRERTAAATSPATCALCHRWKWQLEKGPLWPREKGPPDEVGRGESEPAAHRETSPTTAPSVRQSVPSFLVNILGCRARGA